MAGENRILSKIKELEQGFSQNFEDTARCKKLRDYFTELNDTPYGSLDYMDVTTAEDIKKMYDVDTEDYFEALDTKKLPLEGSSNPNNYAFLINDLGVIVIERTKRNEAVGKKIISLIISELGKQ